MHKIKITEPGFAGYTGNLAMVDFVDGVSTRECTPFELTRLGAIMRFEHADSGVQIGAASEALASRTTPMGGVVAASIEPPAVVTVPQIYTYEELAAIADSEGIVGLRKIGDALDVKSRSIPELIKVILEAQVKVAVAELPDEEEESDEISDEELTLENIDEALDAQLDAAKKEIIEMIEGAKPTEGEGA